MLSMDMYSPPTGSATLLAALGLRFESPSYLFGLLLIPILFWLSYRSLAGIGGVRRWLAILARSAVIATMILALAGTHWIRQNNTLGVIVALDRSSSIPREMQARGYDFLRGASATMGADDRLAVLAFDGVTAVEQLPMGSLGIDRVSEAVEQEQTNVAAALRMSMALFPPDAARRLVVVSDGNENVGRLLDEAEWFAASKVPIDVLPIRYDRTSEVVFERLTAPPTAKQDETVSLQMVLRSQRQDGRAVSGKIVLYHNDEIVDLDDSGPGAGYPVTLDPGLSRFKIPVPLRVVGAQRFRAVFQPDEAGEDAVAANNVGETFTIVGGEGRVLIVTTPEDQPSALLLKAALDRERLACDTELAGEQSLDPVRLLAYSLIILSNVPANDVSEANQNGLVTFVRDVGGGLIMVGGDASFGAGGWLGSPLEDIMPVAFDVKNKKQIPKGALALVMHACEIPRGNYWGERVAVAAVKTLSSRDLVGVLAYNWTGGADGHWVVPLQTAGDKHAIVQRILQMNMGDMPDLDEVMRPAVEALKNRKDAAAKHMIVISDFDPSSPKQDLIDTMTANKITCSTVAIGYGGHQIDERKANWIATSTGGKFYRTNNYAELPQIFIKESRVVRRALINEIEFTPQLVNSLPQTVAGFSAGEFPLLRGYVVTTPKPLAQLPLINKTTDGDDPILAHWQVGLGRTVAFTSGMWPRWGADWTEWPRFSKLWAQIARWASRRTEEPEFNISTSLQGGKGKIRVEALDRSAESIDFLNIGGTLVRPAPEYAREPLRLTQTGPGRYEAEFDARQPGNYLVNLGYKAGEAGGEGGRSGFLQSGLSVAYSPEFRDLRSNLSLLSDLAQRTGGRVLDWNEADKVFDRGSLPRAHTRAPIWEDLIRLMVLLFLLDVAIRRIAVSPLEMLRKARRWLAEVAGRAAPASEEALATLKATRSRVRESLPSDAGGAAKPEAGAAPAHPARYEPPTPDRRVTEDLSKALGGAAESDAPVVARPTRKPTPTTEAEYTSRLLRAKRRARDDMQDDSKEKP
ncbi:MAG: hypothetical protein CHACPFDD_00823 [Phycisphaerae bacterium]|nr:hypothetical protein [Phycisphaerae bacterium]